MKEFLHEVADSVQNAVTRRDMNWGEDLGLGADGTTTSLIDKVAEDLVVEIFQEEYPDINILSEELGYMDNGGENTLVLDPIDGTYNATHGFPFFSLSMAIGNQTMSDCHYGLVRHLTSGVSYWAEKGKGAFKDGIPIKPSQPKRDKLVLAAYLGQETSDRGFQIAHIPRRVRAYGSAALEICMVAEGMLDGFHLSSKKGYRDLRVVDIAAATLILREAGGEVYDDDGNPVDLPFKVNARSQVLAVGDKVVLEWIK